MNEARLVIEGLGNWVYTHRIGDAKRVTIGRSPENEVSLNDLHASANHAEITQKNGEFFIRDLGSRNGTLLNGEKIDRVKLEDGAVIKIGASKLHFMTGDDVGFGCAGPETDEQMDQRIAEIRESETETGIIEFPSEEEMLRELREARGQVRRLKIVAEFAATLAKQPTELSMLGAGLRFVCKNVGAENGFLMQINAETQKWSVRARFGAILDWTLMPGEDKEPQLPMSLTVVERVIKSGKPVFSLSAVDDPRFSAAKSIESLGIMACLCQPLLSKGKAVGVLYCDRRINSAPFSRSEEKLFIALADQWGQILYPGAEPAKPTAAR